MEFRWVALIALWTFLVAPILGAPSGPPAPRRTSSPHVLTGKSTPTTQRSR
jgi:hypothetical protein